MTKWPRAVIFDLDGTLVDTVGDLAAALNATLAERGLPYHPVEAVRTMVGGGLAKLLDRALEAHGLVLADDERGEAEARLFELYAAKPAALSRLYPGAKETLHALSEAGIAIGLCTNKPASMSRDVLHALGIVGPLACRQCGDGDLPKKPHPAGLLKVLERLGARPEDAIMVGDSVTDVEAARAASLSGVVLVSHGYSAIPVAELGADAVIDDLRELPAALVRLAAR